MTQRSSTRSTANVGSAQSLRHARPAGADRRPRRDVLTMGSPLNALGALVLDAVDRATNAPELQLAVEIARQQGLFGSRRLRIEPGIIGCLLEDRWLPVVQLPHRLAGGHGDDRAARHLELPVMGP